MKLTSYCPECGQVLSARAKQCRCGWKLPVISPQEPLSDGRCEYFLEERRCPLPGTLCNHPYSKGPWYCLDHWRCLGDLCLSEAALCHAEENYKAIIAARRDWRDTLLDEQLNLLKKAVVKSTDNTPSNNLHLGDKSSEH